MYSTSRFVQVKEQPNANEDSGYLGIIVVDCADYHDDI